ncbi:MAG: formimidoylglutamate deiminase, partial [Pseudomonadota bacterium]
EVTEVAAALGARPVEWLCDRMPLDAQWCLIHATQMRASETERVARTGATVGLCPITEANLGDGIFPATAFVGKGGRFGVGTDSNVHIAYFEELCLLEYGQRLRDHSRAALADEDGSPGRLLVEQSLAAGASAAGRETGQIAVGHWGDLLGLTTQTAWLCDRTGDGALDTLIFGGRGRDSITDLWSAGRRIVRDGQHPKRATIAARFRDAMTTLGAAL